MTKLKVAIICEHSGAVRDEFIRLGHDAVSCDLLPSDTPGPHIQGDARDQDWRGFDLAICHPTCTYLCNSGVRWLHERPGRWQLMEDACAFFRWCLALPVPHIGVENPIPHKYAVQHIGRKYDQIIQPWMFGDGYTKATCLWLRNLPKLESTDIVDGRVAQVHRASPGPDRWKLRSRTYPGIARAMAAQWGGHVASLEADRRAA